MPSAVPSAMEEATPQVPAGTRPPNPAGLWQAITLAQEPETAKCPDRQAGTASVRLQSCVHWNCVFGGWIDTASQLRLSVFRYLRRSLQSN